MEERLLELLAAERSGVFALRAMLRTALAEDKDLFTTVLDGERDSCRVLGRDLLRAGASPGNRVGDFHLKVLALADPKDRLRLLIKGQSWVVRKIDEALALAVVPDLLADLGHIRSVHQENIAAVVQKLMLMEDKRFMPNLK